MPPGGLHERFFPPAPVQPLLDLFAIVGLHLVVLQGIAAEEYDDPRRWRPIAEANGINNPLTLPVGQGVVIPTLK